MPTKQGERWFPGDEEARLDPETALMDQQNEPGAFDEAAALAASQARVHAQEAMAAADTAAGDATDALTLLEEIANDALLTPVEKPPLVREKAENDAEYQGIYDAGTAHGLPTERDAYEDAKGDLDAYLATLLLPVPWNDTNGNTEIVQATFRATWVAYYTARQVLLNAIAEKDRVAAGLAQADATAALEALIESPDWDENAGVPLAGVKIVNPVSAPAWEAGSYAGGAVVYHGGVIYRTPSATSAEPPDAPWQVYAALRVGPSGMQVGEVLVDEFKSAALHAIGRWGTQVDLAWYRGMSRGAPVLDAGDGTNPRLRVWANASRFVAGQMLVTQFDFWLEPKTDTDNLDGLRYIEVTLYDTDRSALDAVNAPPFYVPLPDRRYANPGTPSHADNSIRVSATYSGLSFPFGGSHQVFTGYMRCKVISVDGFATLDFNFTGMSTRGFATPGHWTLGGSGGGSGGGGVGGNCVAPETPVFISPTQTKPVGLLKTGDVVWTIPESGGLPGYYPVSAAALAANARVHVRFMDGRSFICSHNHMINVRGIWRRAYSLRQGEEVQGQPSGHIESIKYLGEGPVVKLTVKGAHTYLAGDGAWHHNVYKP